MLAQKQLFLDDILIDEAINISTFMVRPEQYEGNPILKADQLWEQGTRKSIHGLQMAWQGVLYDEQEQQDDAPVENIMAGCETGYRYGFY